ncbi:MAG: response regulator [Pseudomonadales bacterium]|nr:response regulator [Pseudomonadales bacterium]
MNQTASVLLFEDDKTFQKLVTHLLQSEGHSVIALDGWPDGGWKEIISQVNKPFDLAVIDYHLPGKNGLEISRLIKAEAKKHTSIVFFSGDKSQDVILTCYKENALDFIQKPIAPEQLATRLSHACELSIEKRQLREQASVSRNIAMKAMSNSGELGKIIQFLESSFEWQNLQSGAEGLFEILSSMGLRTTIKFYQNQVDTCFYEDHQTRPIESQLIDSCRDAGRIVEFSSRCVFNFPHLSLLIKNMPSKDDESYGGIKDNVCLLLNGAEASLAALETAMEAGRHRSQIAATTQVIKMMIHEIETSNLQLSERFQSVIESLEIDMLQQMMHFNLLETEEAALMSTLSTSIAKAGDIFDQCIEQEAHFKSMMQDLAKSLER